MQALTPAQSTNCEGAARKGVARAGSSNGPRAGADQARAHVECYLESKVGENLGSACRVMAGLAQWMPPEGIATRVSSFYGVFKAEFAAFGRDRWP